MLATTRRAWGRAASAGQNRRSVVMPRRLREHDLLRPGQSRGGNPVKLTVLPLPDPPVLFVKVILQLDLAQDRSERPRLQFLDHGHTIDLAYAFNRLLQHLKRRIRYWARPTIRFLARHLQMTF